MLIGFGLSLMAGLKSSAYPAALFAGGEVGVWYDPSDLTTLFQDSAGTTPVTAAGQTVGKILDKSGRGNHATQSTSARRPTYQIDASGRPYLSFDGVDDFMVTNTITPNTNKVQMFFGRRKLRETTREMMVEFATGGGVNGAASLDQSNNAGAITYSFTSRGTIGQGASISGVSAPVTNVFTALGDISGATAEFRVNGAFGNINVGGQGTGNYLAYPLYIGCRGGSLLFSNMNFYSLIVRFGSNLTTGQITSTETWVNGKTGAY